MAGPFLLSGRRSIMPLLTRRGFAVSTAALAASAALPGTLPGSRAGAQTTPAGWSEAPGLPLRVQEIYPGLLDGRIYVLGGLTPDLGPDAINISDRFLSWAPGDTEWREHASFPVPVHHPQLIGFNGRLMAIGGFTSDGGDLWSMRREILAYDPAGDRWQEEEPMAQPLAETVSAVSGDSIHLVTGRRPQSGANQRWTDHADVNAHIVLRAGHEDWVPAPPAPTARNSAASVLVNGMLHVIGGRTVSGGNTPVHEAFDLEAGRWSTLAPLPVPAAGPRGAGGLAAAQVYGTIFTFGGEWFDDGGGVYDQVWAYDTREDRWREATRMPTPRHGLGAVALDGAIYTIGGAAQAGGVNTSASVEVFRP
ncbi:galactose oxidase [Marinicauda pacifica]|uniref:Galactose oxidase n=2 Tax=Marinicauda pacifica TaxID=1133559 RepID=A0A4S2HF19_9PROT|nr:galactose oxidase [Marinicauda pacifica]